MPSNKAQKMLGAARAKLEAELARNPRARGVLTPDAVDILRTPNLSETARKLVIGTGIDRWLAGNKTREK